MDKSKLTIRFQVNWDGEKRGKKKIVIYVISVTLREQEKDKKMGENE